MTLALERPRVAGETADRELALLAKALGHPARVRILRLLLEEDVFFYGELARRLPIAQATVGSMFIAESESVPGTGRGSVGTAVTRTSSRAPRP